MIESLLNRSRHRNPINSGVSIGRISDISGLTSILAEVPHQLATRKHRSSRNDGRLSLILAGDSSNALVSFHQFLYGAR